MPSEHRLIGDILIGLLLTASGITIGLFFVRPMLNSLSPAKFKRLPFIWAVWFLPFGIVSYYLNDFMLDGRDNILKALTPFLVIYAVNMVGWVSSYVSRRRSPGRS